MFMCDHKDELKNNTIPYISCAVLIQNDALYTKRVDDKGKWKEEREKRKEEREKRVGTGRNRP